MDWQGRCAAQNMNRRGGSWTRILCAAGLDTCGAC